MVYRFAVCCLLLLVLLTCKATPESGFFNVDPRSYCPIPIDVLEGKAPAPAADFRVACEHRRQEDAEKIKQSVATIAEHLKNQTKAAGALREKVKRVMDVIPVTRFKPELEANRRVLDELRAKVLVVAIEADRTEDAFNQYVILRAWQNWQPIVDQIFQNPRRKWRHVENLLGFIRILPSRQERIAYYHYVKQKMVPKKDYESYVGVMFAIDARNVVYDADGKTVLNETDERALWTTMIDGSAAYFRRALLTGGNRLELTRLDQNYPELFDLIFPKLFEVTDQELKTFNSWRMMEAPCLMHRPKSKARLFQELLNLLQKRFKWEKRNEFYGPMMAAFLEACLPQLQQDKDSNAMIAGLKKSFEKFGNGKNYAVLLKRIGKHVHTYAG